jgi:hypothetical protein
MKVGHFDPGARSFKLILVEILSYLAPDIPVSHSFPVPILDGFARDWSPKP